MNMLQRLMFLILTLAVGTSPQAAAEHANGHLVIAGGGLRETNTRVFGRIAALGGPGATAAILPTASGVPESSGPGAVGDFDRYLGPGAAEVVWITEENPAPARDEATADQIRRHRIVYFTGGDQSRILTAFRPKDGDTPAYQACLDVLAGGGVIAGSSAGAAMMSDPTLRGGSSPEALRHGPVWTYDGTETTPGVLVGQGMGFLPYGMTGQHFLARGRLGRLIVAMEAYEQRFGYGINENRAIHVDLAAGTVEALGPEAAVLIDLRPASREGWALRNVRLSLLGDGDRVVGASGEVNPGHGADAAEWRRGEPAGPVEDVWADDAMLFALRRLVIASEVIAHGERFTLTFSRDAASRLFERPKPEPDHGRRGDRDDNGAQPNDGFSILNVRLDIEPIDTTGWPVAPPWLD